MITQKRPLRQRYSDDLSSTDAWRHVVIWILLAIASLLMVGFTILLGDMPQRGDLRRDHQNASGLLKLSEEMPGLGIDVTALLSLTSDKLMGR